MLKCLGPPWSRGLKWICKFSEVVPMDVKCETRVESSFGFYSIYIFDYVEVWSTTPGIQARKCAFEAPGRQKTTNP